MYHSHLQDSLILAPTMIPAAATCERPPAHRPPISCRSLRERAAPSRPTPLPGAWWASIGSAQTLHTLAGVVTGGAHRLP